MAQQRCPNCRARNDVSVFVHGQFARCVRCGLRFQVDRSASQPGAAQAEGNPTEIASAPTEVEAAPEPQQKEPGVTPMERPSPPRRAPSPGAGGQEVRKPEISGYECTSLLGRGGMGEVWRARQLSLERTVAIKILADHLAIEPDYVRRFERESNALAALSHPHIVRVFDRGNANGHWYFVMEFVDGRSLREHVAEKKPSRAGLLRIMAEVARAVDYAHRHGVIHRDLKPENILVDATGHAVVADFGLAGMSEAGRSSLTMSAVAMGTAHYMAPEQRRDAKKVDGRADLYSLGVVLYELLTHELPVGRFPAPREKVPDLDRRLDALILRLLDQHPDKRPASASEVAELLEELAGRDEEKRRPTPVLRSTRAISSVVREVRSSPAKTSMAVASVGLLALLVVLGLWRATTSPAQEGWLPAAVEREADSKAALITFGDGERQALHTVGEGWRIRDGVLLRSAAASQSERPARAYLSPVRLNLTEASIQVDVVVEPGRSPEEAPAAEVVLYRDADRHIGVRLSFAEDGGVSLFHSTPGRTGPVTRVEDGRFESPQYGRSYRLALMLTKGRATALVDGKPVVSLMISSLGDVRAKPAVGCRAGVCRFSELRLAGNIVDAPPAENEPVTASKP